MPSAADIAGKYEAKSFKGEPIESIKVEITDEGNHNSVKFHAVVANTFNGTLKFSEDGKLKGMLMSTRMMGPPNLMAIEAFFGKGFHTGMKVTKDNNNNQLILSSEDGDEMILAKK